MKIDILTLFPKMFESPFSESVLKRAIDKGILDLKAYNIRDVATDKHKTVDDTPYGGGPGMVMRVDIIDQALEKLKNKNKKTKIILMTPQGQRFDQKISQKLSKNDHLVFICGRYEGYDERIRSLVDEEISIGDYVLTGGEIPAMAVIDATVRLIPGVVGKEDSLGEESFSTNLLEYPQYTRPFEYKGMKVPEVLISGNHENISNWRKEQSITKTKKRRPDLLK